jgi:hypothetical protein
MRPDIVDDRRASNRRSRKSLGRSREKPSARVIKYRPMPRTRVGVLRGEKSMTTVWTMGEAAGSGEAERAAIDLECFVGLAVPGESLGSGDASPNEVLTQGLILGDADHRIANVGVFFGFDVNGGVARDFRESGPAGGDDGETNKWADAER